MQPNAEDEKEDGLSEDRMNKIFELARKVRRRLKETGKTSGHIKCPFCDNARVDAKLHKGGRRGTSLDSLHMKCRTLNCLYYME